MLASPSGKYGNPLSPCWVKTSDYQEQSLIGTALPSDFSPLFLTHFCFSFYNLCYLDESTQPGVSMTESRTHSLRIPWEGGVQEAVKEQEGAHTKPRPGKETR